MKLSKPFKSIEEANDYAKDHYNQYELEETIHGNWRIKWGR